METGRGNPLIAILVFFSALPVAVLFGKLWDRLNTPDNDKNVKRRFNYESMQNRLA
jgi:hypothetical protein